MAYAVLPVARVTVLSGEFTDSSRLKDGLKQTFVGHFILLVVRIPTGGGGKPFVFDLAVTMLHSSFLIYTISWFICSSLPVHSFL